LGRRPLPDSDGAQCSAVQVQRPTQRGARRGKALRDRVNQTAGYRELLLRRSGGRIRAWAAGAVTFARLPGRQLLLSAAYIYMVPADCLVLYGPTKGKPTCFLRFPSSRDHWDYCQPLCNEGLACSLQPPGQATDCRRLVFLAYLHGCTTHTRWCNLYIGRVVVAVLH
jgi:hypothetical protein